MSLFKKLIFKEKKNKKKHNNLDADFELIVPDVTDHHRNPYNEIQILDYHSCSINFILKVDNYRCLSISIDGFAVLWDVQTGTYIRCLRRPDGRPFTTGVINYVKANNKFLFISASNDKTVQLWDIESGICEKTLESNSSNIRCLLCINEGKVICAAGSCICLWTINGHSIANLCNSTPEDIVGIISVQDSILVARADTCLYVYKMKSFDKDTVYKLSLTKVLPPHRESISVLSKFSKNYFVSGSIDGTIILWRTADMLPTKYFNSVRYYEGDNKSYPYSIQHIISIDERYICAAVGNGIYIFDSVNGRTVVEMKACHQSKIVHMDLVWDDLMLATCSQDGTVRFWGQSSTFDSAVTQIPCNQLYNLLELKSEDISLWKKDKKPLQMDILGECSAHSGTVKTLLDFRDFGIITASVDPFLILWKNSEIESIRRMNLLQEINNECLQTMSS